jgi:hypothetical protein
MVAWNVYQLASRLVVVLLVCSPLIVAARPVPQSADSLAQAVTPRRLLLLTVAENGNVPYAEHHSAAPLQPFNILGQAIVNGANTMNEKALNRLNAKQSSVTAMALTDYDFKNKILDAAKMMASKNEWLGIAEIRFSSNAEPTSTADASENENFESLLHLRCNYRFPLDFGGLIVRCDFGTQVKDGAEGASDPKNSRLAARSFEVYVPLEDSKGIEASENAARWSDRGAALARQALDIAVARLPEVLNSGLATEPVPPGTPIRNVKHVGHYMGVVANNDATGTLVSLGGVMWSYEFERGVGE